MMQPIRSILFVVAIGAAVLSAGCSSGGAPETLPGMLDIAWGDSPEVAKIKMLEKPGVELLEDSADYLAFTGGTFMGHEVERWTLSFWRKEKFWFAAITPREDPLTGPELKADLQQQFGQQYGRSSDGLTWRFRMEGEEKTNTISIVSSGEEPLQIWYMGSAYSDKLNREDKGN